MSMSKHNNGVPHGVPHGVPDGVPHGVPDGVRHGFPDGVPLGFPVGVVIDNKYNGKHYMRDEYDINEQFRLLVWYVCDMYPNHQVTFVCNKGRINVELPPESGFSFLSICDYNKYRVIMTCVKRTNPGELDKIAKLADTPRDCSTFQEMVGYMLGNISALKEGNADLTKCV
jgi:hypothetical protein